MDAPRVHERVRLDHRTLAGVLALVDAATEADGVRPLSEHVMLHLRYGGEPQARTFLLTAGDDLVGFGHLDPTDPVEGPSGELVVHPGHRRHGYGRLLTRALIEAAAPRPLRLWAHGEHPGAERLALSLGFVRIRALWQMRRSLYAPLPAPRLPQGVTVRPFSVGADEDAWVEVNRRAFAQHPEQGGWTREDLVRREREPWFDPAGFFLAERGGEGPGAAGRRLVGFHWTKVHGAAAGDRPAEQHGHEPIGEVYVVGVDPGERGGGLGRALTLVGLRHLRGRGLPQVMLYVDEANSAAIRLYGSLGFTHWDTDVMYRR